MKIKTYALSLVATSLLIQTPAHANIFSDVGLKLRGIFNTRLVPKEQKEEKSQKPSGPVVNQGHIPLTERPVIRDNKQISAGVTALLGMHSRPTIEDFENAFRGWPATNPFGTQATLTYNIEALLPEYIVQLEAAYPGAKYAFLGRDSVVLADLFDIYYRSRGELDRVIRLNGSGTSIRPATHGEIIGFLKTNGIDVNTIDREGPIVMLDPTSWGNGSQLKYLMTEFYKEYQATGKDSSKLLKKLVAVPSQYYPHYRISPHGNGYDQYINTLQQRRNSIPENVQSIDAAALNYTAEWHATFDKFINYNGKIIAPPGDNMPHTHAAIMSEIYEAHRVITTDAFRKSVERVARQYGIEENFLRRDFIGKSKEEIAKILAQEKEEREIKEREAREIAEREARILERKTVADKTAELNALIKSLPPFTADGEPLSDNATKLYQWLKANTYQSQILGANASIELLMITLDSISNLDKEGYISGRDLRRIVKRVFASSPYTKDSLDSGVGEIFSDEFLKMASNNRIGKILDRHEAYFMNTEHKAGPNGSRVYNELKERASSGAPVNKCIRYYIAM